ncbi:MAG TPA: sigma-54-dependent Fis family transcriptional regulator, partial [Marine Group III euryarchaeote]|nr:sigma-54-dependent Fis family transcriptional regulator [Marine Group III euryarchaeote]
MNNQTVLVVDDEPAIRGVVSEILEDEGYRVDSAGDGSEAREKFNRLSPDLVLLDIWMPDTDGITLLTEWCEQSSNRPPVIMISGHGTVETAVDALRLGAYDFLEKPLSTAKLLVTVERALESRQLFAENTLLRRQLEPVAELVGHSPNIQELKQ